jgi:hypothetical protein
VALDKVAWVCVAVGATERLRRLRLRKLPLKKPLARRLLPPPRRRLRLRKLPLKKPLVRRLPVRRLWRRRLLPPSTYVLFYYS